MTIDFQRLFQALPSPFMVIDRNLVYVEANDAYQRAVMLDREAMETVSDILARLAALPWADRAGLALMAWGMLPLLGVPVLLDPVLLAVLPVGLLGAWPEVTRTSLWPRRCEFR